jgi:hypothetical protein
VGADARVADCLPLVCAILHKIVNSNWRVIGMRVLHVDAVLERPTFEFVFGFQSFANTKRDLVSMADHSRGVVYKQSATGVVFQL